MAIHLGTTRIDAYHYIAHYADVCRNCNGTGTVNPNQLPDENKICWWKCKGSGRVKVTKDITISVEPMALITNP